MVHARVVSQKYLNFFNVCMGWHKLQRTGRHWLINSLVIPLWTWFLFWYPYRVCLILGVRIGIEAEGVIQCVTWF